MTKFIFKDVNTMTYAEKRLYRQQVKTYQRTTKAYIYMGILIFMSILVALVTN
jgi:hypothetical protein